MLLTIRTYALYNGNKRLLAILLVVGVVGLAVSYHLYGGTTFINLGFLEATLIAMNIMAPTESPVKITPEALGCDSTVSLPRWVASLL